MTRRKFVYTSTLTMLVLAVTVAGLAFFTDFTASAALQDLPAAIRYLPADCQAVFGMNVQKFVASPVYVQMNEKHGQKIGTDLEQFIAATGVDPRRDVAYIIGAARGGDRRDSGIVMAVGTFNQATILDFIRTKTVPVNRDYKGYTVLAMPDGAGTSTEKGIAFLNGSVIAVGDVPSLNAVIDVAAGAPGIQANIALRDLLSQLSAEDMFWFAGDAPSILSKAPANTPVTQTLSSVTSVFGTLNLTTMISGKVTVVAADDVAAAKLSDFVKGLLALGSLAGAQNADLAQLIQRVQIAQQANQFTVTLDFPMELLQKLEAAKTQIRSQVR
ncbi:MAG: hypothetical protein H6Q05_1288 [Acidobacteria bacterium]|nr:hypothetical protein [Acidobacteriota bacterium]